MRKKLLLQFLAALFIVNSLIAFSKASDHAPLAKEHVQVAENFTSTHLKTGYAYDLNKILNFISRLEQEKTALISDAYETKIIEKIEFEVNTHKEALKSAKNELDEKKSKYLVAYDQFLIPKIKELYSCVETKKPVETCDGIVDQFYITYGAFYLPEAPRNIFHQDRDFWFFAKNLFGFEYKRFDNRVEASNLLVEEENLSLSRQCLPELKVNDILSQKQISALKKCGLDISIYNPAGAALWRKHTPDSYVEARNLHNDWFPADNEILYYKKIKFSSAGSPKLEAEFKRNDKNIDVKVKMGFETHTEITTSILGKMLGFYQDTSFHRKKVKLYFKEDTDYEAFKAQWSRKYDGLNKEYTTYVLDYGKDSIGQWVELQDVQLSVNDPKFYRLGPYDPAGWDLPNRREQRSQVLWFGFVNMFDVKPGNHTVLLEKTDAGYVPRLSMQDVGYSLHFQVNIKRIFHMLMNALSWGVNTYSDSFLDWDDEEVHITWSDVMFNRERFNTTTYADLKWMARQIAKLSHDDIKYAVTSAGFPPDVADLYIHKITSRRNEVVKAFSLQKEFSLYKVPNLENYSPNKNIKNGEIVVSHFKGYASYELPRTTILPLILQAATSYTSLKSLNDRLQVEVNKDISANYQDQLGKTIKVNSLNLIPGISLMLDRSVDINEQFVVRNGKTQAFVVKDRFVIEINIGSSLFSRLKGLFSKPLAVNANIQAWRREFEFIHFADTWLDGYTSEVKLFKFIHNWRSCVVECLDNGEVLKISDSYGVSISGRPPVGDIANLPLSVGGSVFWQNSKPTYFLRDQFGQLTVYHAENHNTGAGFSLALGDAVDLILFNLPLLEYSNSSSIFTHKSALYRFSVYNNKTHIIEQKNHTSELDLLNRYLDYGDSDALVLSRKDLDIAAKGTRNNSVLNFLMFWRKESNRGSSIATVKTSKKETRKFLRYNSSQTSLFGADKSILIIDNDATVVYKDTTNIAVEMDEEDTSKLIAYVEVWNYERKLNRSKLIDYINDLNKFYSRDTKTPIYRDYFLPPKSEVNTYRKIYGQTRVYFNGDALVQKLLAMNTSQLEKLYSTHYKGNRTLCQNSKSPCMYEISKNSFTAAVRKMKAQNVKNSDYLKLYNNILVAIDLRKNGITLPASLLSDKDMFVMGEIYGVLPSFSTQQQDEPSAGRRFAAKSWGAYKVPPLREFLHNHMLTTDSMYVNGGISFDDIFGSMPSGTVSYY